jgi:hypothetical protein
MNSIFLIMLVAVASTAAFPADKTPGDKTPAQKVPSGKPPAPIWGCDEFEVKGVAFPHRGCEVEYEGKLVLLALTLFALNASFSGFLYVNFFRTDLSNHFTPQLRAVTDAPKTGDCPKKELRRCCNMKAVSQSF